MKSVAVYFDAPAFDDYPFNKPLYAQAYHEFAALLAQKGVTFFIVREQSTYVGKNVFQGVWIFQDGSFQRREGKMYVDLIYNKGYFKADDGAHVLNDPKLDDLCTDKWKTYQLIPNLSPMTVIAHDAEGLDTALHNIPSDLTVVKPLDGEEGEGVEIAPKAEIRAKDHSYPLLVQEFLDTSAGIPDIVGGTHDFRLTSINGEIIVCFVRTPPPKSLIANVALGGAKKEIPIAKIPNEALSLFRKVEEKLTAFPVRIYATDMGRTVNGEWKIIELNSKPGLNPRSKGPNFARFQDVLADTLISALP